MGPRCLAWLLITRCMDFVAWSEVLSEIQNVHMRPQPKQMGKAGEQGANPGREQQANISILK